MTDNNNNNNNIIIIARPNSIHVFLSYLIESKTKYDEDDDEDDDDDVVGLV